jgi:hypothetical protein
MDQRLEAVRAKKKTRWRECSCIGCVIIAISQPSKRDMPRDFARYATVREVEDES